MIEHLLSPINTKQPAGSCEEEYLPLEELDDLMLKYGSLHQSTIDWEKVEVLCVQILQKKCKHYRVLLHLVTYWLNKRNVDGLIDSLQLLTGFMEKYWSNGHPNPGNANIRYRKKFSEQILFRIDQGAGRLLKDNPSPSTIEALNAALLQLEQQIKKRKLDAGLKKLHSRLAELKPLLTQPTAADQPAQPAPSSHEEQPAKTAPKLADLGDERQIKRLLFDLANIINAQNADDPLGYQLRRYALWSGIQSAPPVNQQGESALLPPPADLTQEYEELINAGAVTIALLQRIEKSIVASPFWLTGSLYASMVLHKLKYENAAQAVLQSVEDLLQRLPSLMKDKFAGGECYIQPKQLKKLQAQHRQAGTAKQSLTTEQNAPAMEWEKLQKDWHSLRKKQGIASVLEQAEKYQHTADTPRQKFYLKLLAGEQLQAAGLQQLAKDLLATTVEQVEVMPVNEWEPNYLQRAQTILGGK